MSLAYFRSPLVEIPAATLYRLMMLRQDVFVVEQEAAYPDLDGRDLETSALLFWVEDDDQILATLRVLTDPAERRIGRVATAASARGRGLAAELMTRAIDACGSAPIVVDAQAQLEGWYARFGFARSGPNFVEDGIPHIPMRRPAAS
jgi:ElaA protein